ncbi:MAG TPA: YraN family protein [Phycisphaerae bacterium]|nr:YraN family protein [Phycisphaerales bacterium]HRX84966.1 YraN family protein [Phycisphaerae bacterium]
MMRLGPSGEQIGARYLRRQGYRIIKRNYRCTAGEIDIVAGDRDTLVFVEVKTRRSDEAADPEAAVNHHKRVQITRAARFFIAESRAERVPCRFDVLAIVLPADGRPEVTHFINAFTPTPK